METLNDKILEVTAEVGKFKNVNELESYFISLPESLKTNGMLINLYKKRKSWINDMRAKLDPNNCSRCGEMLGFDENDNKICYICRF